MENSERKLAVITGASSGIGYELAKQFAENGFDLLICSNSNEIVEAAQGLKSFGGVVESTRCDLATYDGVEDLYRNIKSLGRPVEAIAINAGVGVGGASFDKTDLEEELNLLRLNVVGVVHLTKRILPDMIEAGHGKILFTSSVAAFLPGPYESVYSASKAFVQSFSEAIRFETKDKGITVTALQPGPTETNFFHRAGMDETKVGDQKKDDAAVVAKQGFDALMEGRGEIIAGSMMNKIQANLGKIMPQKAAAKMHETMTRPNSPKDR